MRSRLYAGPTDIPKLARFLTSARAITGHCGYYHLGDLYWGLFLAERRGHLPDILRVWEDDSGELLGFAWYYPPEGVDIQVSPTLPNREPLEREMLAWATEYRLQFPPRGSEPLRLITTAFEDDLRWMALLEGLGFTREEDHKVHMLWDLIQPLPAPKLPEGYRVRSITGPNDFERRAAVQKAVWPHSKMSVEAYPQLQALPGYEQELDLVVEAADGRFAAFAICWMDNENRSGEFEPVGTHPEFRRLGLSKAVLHEGLHRLRNRGANTAFVYPMGGDPPSEGLYRSAGFQPINRQWDYARLL